MGGPVLSGGVIVLVSALLWLLYFLPIWRGNHQYNAAERNAVRLNQALRVLAETSETPEEVKLELSARTAYHQQKLARRVQSEREAAELRALREELASIRTDPAVRQARARRIVRLTASMLLLAGLAGTVTGIWQVASTGASGLLWTSLIVGVLAVATLQRMATVARRAARRARPVTVIEERVSPEIHDQGPAEWTPRQVPQSLTAQAGSRAHAARAAAEAHEALLQAARTEVLRQRAEEIAPPAPEPIVPAAPERPETVAATPEPTRTPDAAPTAPAEESPYARMGYVDDAEIEQHVRALLNRRAAG